MKCHRLNSSRAPSRHSTWPADNGSPQASTEGAQQPSERSDHPPIKHPEKAVSRRLHRKHAATYLGTSLSWLDKSRLRGDGPVFIQIGGRVIYDTADLDSYLASRRRQSTSEPH